MRSTLFGLLAAATVTATATVPAAAQEWQVARDQFPFAGTRLEVQVDSDVGAEGVLRVIRGGPGRVSVAGRAGAGFVAAGLTHDQRLTLSALGDGPVQYLVSVPEGVWLTIRLPDRYRSESLASSAPGGTYRWGEAVEPPAAASQMGPPVTEWVPPSKEPFDVPLFTAYTDYTVPSEIALPELDEVRSITVRVGGDRFSVSTTRPLSVDRGDPRRLEIRPKGPPMDIVLVVPDGTAAFSLLASGTTALRVEGDQVTTYCNPVTRQWLSDGRRWVTFTPVEGALDCGAPRILRHKG